MDLHFVLHCPTLKMFKFIKILVYPDCCMNLAILMLLLCYFVLFIVQMEAG